MANTWSSEIKFNLNPTKAKKGLLKTFWKKIWKKKEFEKWHAICVCVGGVLAWGTWGTWVACAVSVMLLLLLLLLLKYYPEERNIECLLLNQKWKNVLNNSEQWFKRRTKCGQIRPNMSNLWIWLNLLEVEPKTTVQAKLHL